MKTVMVRWKQRGMLIRDRYASPRNPGDEDEMTEREARRYAVANMVAILPDSEPPIFSGHVDVEVMEDQEPHPAPEYGDDFPDDGEGFKFGEMPEDDDAWQS